MGHCVSGQPAKHRRHGCRYHSAARGQSAGVRAGTRAAGHQRIIVAIRHFPLKLVSRRMIAPTVAHLVLVRDDGQPLDFISGQFIQVHFEYADGTPTKRSYSLATVHDHAIGPGEAVEIAVSYVPGGATTALSEGLQVGDAINATGPFGRFCLIPRDANRRYLLIGTGTGVTP